MMKRNIAVVLFSSLALSACAKSSETNHKPSKPSPELQQKIQQLVEKTKKNMIFVEGGSYLMGDFGLVTPELEKMVPNSMAVKNPKGNTEKPNNLPLSSGDDNKTLHKVSLSSFNMSAYKTTLEDYNIFTEATGQPESYYNQLYAPKIIQEVATGMDWQQAKDYCQWLGQQVGTPMDLPTEAQWEYVARNKGQYVVFATDTGKVEPKKNLWKLNQYDTYRHTNNPDSVLDIPVLGKTPPNPLGFYDLVTNNYEWMNDWYDKDYYKDSPIDNPTGPKSGTQKVLRSTTAMSADDLMMADGLNIARAQAQPKSNEENKMTYRMYGVRCVANIQQPIK
ncbi:formylglycine-generating enzyme family protein [Acinetobacter calcoaceticus]|uniref:formylglycine-generating enzyme family protein n=1 Tax=Acinetobacter calcoaceticus TaxID=471 RepID=UPI001AE43677|nr:SUMF1/EgtB/PvdO family nonheme iron enzyme [Acinetobacter calcoaceticus]MBP2602824.1 formylglycine-generating enzyme required for sulfatase activity [Acinetobacter calcoaceticus]